MFEFRTADGVIAYELLSGPNKDAPTLTLLHNFMSTGRAAWGSLLDKLQTSHRLLLPDLPGHGRSLGHPAGYAYGDMARQVAELMWQEGAQEGHLAGCSAGGMIAQLLVHEQLVRPRTLTLVSTTYSLNPQTTGNRASLTPEDFIAPGNWLEATAKLHDPYQGEGYFFRELLPGFRTLRAQHAIDLTPDDLRNFSLPTCIIHGENDEFFPRTIVETMQESIPDAELHLIPDQTHALLFRRPWVVGEKMIDFLTRKP